MSEEKNTAWTTMFGMHTDIELDKLKTAFPQPAPGDSYTDEELGDVIGLEKGEPRHKTVVARWGRYLFRGQNTVLLRVRTVGYRIATADERVDHAVDRKHRAAKQVRRATRVLGATNVADISEEKRPEYEHHMQSLRRLALAEDEDRRAMRMLPPTSVTAK
ncbi:MAG: hypothetical protein GY854_19755 [Deltaproteobacteria bacterium]|nr:hypothetical protein [Deltaproteobacteria bacterium]